MVVRFNFERGKSCRYSTYTYSKQLGEFLRVGEGGGAWPTPPPLNPPLHISSGVARNFRTALLLAVKKILLFYTYTFRCKIALKNQQNHCCHRFADKTSSTQRYPDLSSVGDTHLHPRPLSTPWTSRSRRLNSSGP